MLCYYLDLGSIVRGWRGIWAAETQPDPLHLINHPAKLPDKYRVRNPSGNRRMGEVDCKGRPELTLKDVEMELVEGIQ